MRDYADRWHIEPGWGARIGVIVDRGRVAAALPGYELGDLLGSGAFGLVLAAQHRRMARPVAVKIMSAAGADDLTDRFAAEARVLAGLDHPHIVRVHDYLEADELCLIVMEHLGGGTLTRRRASMLPEAACAIGLAVAAALAHAHSKGVLHRDIKADNILFDDDGAVKVTDFGIAKIFEGSAATASVLAGTPMYMAPEIINNGRVGPGTDLYALGIVLYQLLAGRPPFDPKLPLPTLWQQHLTAPPPPLRGVPEPIASVVLKALAKNPIDRHSSAHMFALELANAGRAYGPDWLARATVPVRIDDNIRQAAGQIALPVHRHEPVPPAAPPTAQITTAENPWATVPDLPDQAVRYDDPLAVWRPPLTPPLAPRIPSAAPPQRRVPTRRLRLALVAAIGLLVVAGTTLAVMLTGDGTPTTTATSTPPPADPAPTSVQTSPSPTTQAPAKDIGLHYDETIRSNYLDACLGVSDGNQPYCTCTLEKLEANYTQEEYLQYNANVDSPESQQVTRTIYNACRDLQ
ncbi:serine/threonine protein kinase [Parafrankia sp. EAN1pec]|nr:serine/threonine protein kinase [Frankia sp. EAN1pec]